MGNEKQGQLILITGGVRSGKSSFAEKLAQESKKRVIYLATARAEDQEMRRRVLAHQDRRPHYFETLEEPLEPHLVFKNELDSKTFILLDCLTLLVSNRILADLEQHGADRNGEDILAGEDLLEAAAERALDYVSVLADSVLKCPAEVAVVTNEVGMGLVPSYPLGRVFRDCSGRANQLLADAADQVWLVVCGIPRRFK